MLRHKRKGTPYSATRSQTLQQTLITNHFRTNYPLPAALIGIATILPFEDSGIMWHVPSNIAPASINKHRECTSPLTTPFSRISTRSSARTIPLNFPPTITTRASSWPSTSASSPRINMVCDFKVPCTCEFTRSVPELSMSPTTRIPRSRNPVHSSDESVIFRSNQSHGNFRFPPVRPVLCAGLLSVQQLLHF